MNISNKTIANTIIFVSSALIAGLATFGVLGFFGKKPEKKTKPPEPDPEPEPKPEPKKTKKPDDKE